MPQTATARPQSPPFSQPDVLIIGAGPVGTALGIDLAWRGVKVLVVERDRLLYNDVRARAVNPRTMEHFRRLGFADELRARDGLDPALYDGMVVTTALTAPPLAVLPRDINALDVPGAVAERPELAAERTHILPQPRLVALLRDKLVERGGELALGWEAIRVAQSDDKVFADLRDTASGEMRRVEALYLVGAEGARSLVRDVAGIGLNVTGPAGRRISVTFLAPDLGEATGAKSARFLMPMVDGFDHVTTHAPGEWGFGLGPYPMDADLSAVDLEAETRRIIGRDDVPFSINYARTWPVQRAVAKRYGAGRMFIMGDAAHSCPPTGGQNMNTGIGDAMNLSWKLAATLAGWGGPGLLASYGDERQPIGERNAKWSYDNAIMLPASTFSVATDIEARLDVLKRRGLGKLAGVTLDLRYASDIIAPDEARDVPDLPDWHPDELAPIAAPGLRAPHLWLADGSALFDHLGPGHTLVDFTGAADTAGLVAAAEARAMPFAVLALASPEGRAAYGADFAIIRPDQQVAWRSDALPADPGALLDLLRGA